MKPQKRTTRKQQLPPNPGKSQPTKKGHATKGVLKKCQSRGAGKSLANGGVADVEVWYEYTGEQSMRLAFNKLRPRQNGRHFPDDIFKCILLNIFEFRLKLH